MLRDLLVVPCTVCCDRLGGNVRRHSVIWPLVNVNSSFIDFYDAAQIKLQVKEFLIKNISVKIIKLMQTAGLSVGIPLHSVTVSISTKIKRQLPADWVQ